MTSLRALGLTGGLALALVGVASVADADPVCPDAKTAAAEVRPTEPVRRRTASTGALPGRFAISDRGGATYTMPIAVPPGRQGIEPRMFLHYDSNATEGTLGAGFALTGASAITRCGLTQRDDGLHRGVRFDSRDRFCLDGAKLVVVAEDRAAGWTEYRTRPDQFKRIVARSAPGWDLAHGPASFDVWHKDGRIVTYGGDDESRVRVANRRVTAWLVTREEDRNGNALRYTYLNELHPADRRTVRLYLLRIDYTDHPDARASRRVLFFYRQWEWHRSGFVGGGELWHDRRLHRIKTQVISPDGASRDVRLYKLDYRKSDATQRALLERVRECLSEDDDSCNPPTRFDWQANKVRLGDPVLQLGDSGTHDVLLTADVTGDGLEDVVHVGPATIVGIGTEVKVRVNAGNGVYLQAVSWALESSEHIVGAPQVTDFDGDGRQDLVFGTKSLSEWQVLLAADGRFLRGNSGIPRSRDNVNRLFRLADFDGDGMQDALLCSSEPCQGGCPDTWEVWIGTPLRFKETAPPPQLADIPCWEDVKIVDVHGDGKVDILMPPADYFGDFCFSWGDCNYQTLELDWTTSRVWVASDSGLPVKKGEKTLFIDVNGDGLPDAVQSDGGEPKTYLNTGAGFADPVPAVANPPDTDVLPFDQFLADAHPFEYDGDGNMDLLLSVDDCPGLTPCWSLLRASASGDGTFEVDDSVQIGTSRLAVTDANGDGRHDVVTELSGRVNLRTGSGPNDLLVAVSDGMNASDPVDAGFVPNLAIRYGNLVDAVIQQGITPGSSLEDEARYVSRWSYQNNSCEYPRHCVTGALRVVSGYAVNNGRNEARSFDVRYRNARFDRFGEGWLGFGARIVRDLATRHATAELYDNQTYDDRFFVHPFAHRPVRSWTWTPALAGEPVPTRIALSYVDEELAVEPTRGPTYFVKVVRRESQRLEGDFAIDGGGGETLLHYVSTRGGDDAELLAHTIHELLAVDDFGNVLDERSETVGVEQTRVEREFRNEETKWLIGLPTRERTCSTVEDATQCRLVEREHDDRRRPLSTFTNGSDDELSQQLTVTHTFDAFGNAVTTVASDAFGNRRASCDTFDAEGIFPLAHGNPLGHLEHGAWEPGHGNQVGFKDANGLLTLWTHDGFGRLIHTRHPSGREVRQQYVRTKDGGPTGNWWTTRTRVTDDAAPTQIIEPDMLGRIVERKVAAISVPSCERTCVTGGWLVEKHRFDSLGRVARMTALHHEAFPAAAAVTRYEYDALGRTVERRTPWDSTVRIRYDGNETRVSDSAGTTALVADAAGRPRRLTDQRGTVTSYTYGPFGLPREVVNAGETTRLGYDSLGRLRRLDDPNRGRSESSYTAFGELLLTNDALGRRVTHTHDELGRLRARSGPDGTAKWDWDGGCADCLDSSTSTDGVVTSYSYDALARPRRVEVTIGDQELAVGKSYDAVGRLHELVYPAVAPGGSELVVRYGYETTGRLARVRQVGNPAPATDYWRLLNVDGLGALRESQLGNGVVRRMLRDPRQNVVTELRARKGTQTLQRWTYEYDDRRNPILRRDHVLGRQETLRYDELDRLVCVAAKPESSDCLLSVRYADNGNVDRKSDVGSYRYDSQQPHAVIAAGDAEFAYDAVGNQIERPGMTIAYTSDDLPRHYELEASERRIVFQYDAVGNRVSKRDGGAETLYLPDVYERTGGSSPRHRFHIPLGESELVLTRSGSGTTLGYVHRDLVGSTDVVTDAVGAVVERRAYDAFGARRPLDDSEPPDEWTSSATHLGFTGHESDDEAALVNMRGRVYDPRLARFLQVDPVVSNQLSSQRWNAYSYALNNPLRYVDPTGFDEGAGGGMSGSGGGPSGSATVDVSAPGPLVMPVQNEAVGSEHQPVVDAQPGPPSGEAKTAEPFERPLEKPLVTEIAERALTTALESDRSAVVRIAAGTLAWAAVPFVINEQMSAGIILAPHSAYKAFNASAQQYQRAQELEAAGQDAVDAWLATAQEGALGVAEVAGTVTSLSKVKGVAIALRRAARFVPRVTITHRGIVFARQGGACAGCGIEMTRGAGPRQMNLDHPHPWSKYGAIHPLEAVGLCRTCNLDKSDLELIEWIWINEDALTWEEALEEAAAIEEIIFADSPGSRRR